MYGQGVPEAGNGITSSISNEDMDDINKIIKPPENVGVLIDGVSEIVKNWKSQKDWFLCIFLAILAASLLENILTAKRSHESWKRCRKSRKRI